ncbi:hypothetical protein CBS101457_006151 [Exobasidium rhododendri]|nr:hypothetical protein CBS101457_006151 [Exobasidium rhododendri]
MIGSHCRGSSSSSSSPKPLHHHTLSLGSSTAPRKQASRPALPSCISTACSERSTWWTTREDQVADDQLNHRMSSDIEAYEGMAKDTATPSTHRNEQGEFLLLMSTSESRDHTNSSWCGEHHTSSYKSNTAAATGVLRPGKDIPPLWSYASSLLRRPHPTDSPDSALSQQPERQERKRWPSAEEDHFTPTAGVEDITANDPSIDPHSIAVGIIDYIDEPPRRGGSAGAMLSPRSLRSMSQREVITIPPLGSENADRAITPAEKPTLRSSGSTIGKSGLVGDFIKRQRWLLLLCIAGILASIVLIVLGCLLHVSGGSLVF